MEVQELEKALGNTLAALKKSGDTMKGHFKAMASDHDGMHKAHADMCEACKAHAAMCKAKGDSLPDDHIDKTYYSKVAEHHTAKAAHHDQMAKLHKACSEKFAKAGDDFQENSLPGVANPTGDGSPTTIANPSQIGTVGAATGIEDLIKATTTGLVGKSLEMLKTDGTVQEEIKKMVLEGVKKALGQEIIPSAVRLFPPTDVQPELLKGLKLINRPGGAPLPGDENVFDKVDAGIADMVGA